MGFTGVAPPTYYCSKDRVYYRLKTHLEMLQDRIRCLAYQQALGPVVQDKIVLDVGCGSGILSFFAARAGARLVLAVDMDIPPGAEEVAQTNGLADRIRFFKGRIQDIELPVDSVDIIVSEWMGGLLLMEDMLPAVLYARDRWLKPGGLLLPQRARLFLAPLDNAAGISSKSFPHLRETISAQMWVSVIDPSRFLAEPAAILDLDLNTCSESTARAYETAYRFVMNKTGIFNGFGLWFDVLFAGTRPPLVLSTAPWLPPTHWAQGLWILPADIEVNPDDVVSGIFSQTKITPSTAFFRVEVNIGAKISFSRSIEASSSTMNPSAENDNLIAQQAMSGAYQGCDCLWIGCSMSFAPLVAARNNARSVSVLNHSSWAARAQQQVAAQQGLTNVRFLSQPPEPSWLQNRNICLLGAADASWQALISHIKVRRILGRTDFLLWFYWQESPWKNFYGFDFSPYAPYDLEMYHEEKPFTGGTLLKDTTGHTTAAAPKQSKGEIIYQGIFQSQPHEPYILPDGVYNCLKVSFHCGTVVLPLPESLYLDSSQGKHLRKVELAISLPEPGICRFRIILSCRGWRLQRSYEQPLAAMGHIVRNF